MNCTAHEFYVQMWITGHFRRTLISLRSHGVALSALAEYLDIPRRPIACIGDGENDV